MKEQAPILIVAIPLLMAFLNIPFGLFKRTLSYPITVITTFLCVYFSYLIADTVVNNGNISYRLGGWEPPWGIEYAIDHLNAYMLIIVSIVSFIVAIYSKNSIEKEIAKEKTVYFYTIYLLLVTGLLGIVVTGDLFNLFVFLEIASLAGYALVAIGEDRAPLATFNYIVMGTIGACFYLLGVGYLYIVTGSLNITDLTKLLPPLYHSKVVLVAFAFFVVGVAIKIALFPLHTWLPDAYTHAPSTVSAFVAATMTKVGAYAMIRVMFTVFEPSFTLEALPTTEILGWVASAAMMFGCIMALAQDDLKRMLAYILVAEVGYIVMGVSVGNKEGFIGSVLHILNDSFMMVSLFLVAGAIMYKEGHRNIKKFANLHKKMPVTMGCFVIAAISMVGVPPTAGFFSKWYLILGAINAQKWFFVAFLLLSSLMVAVAFFKIIQNTFFHPSESHHKHEEPIRDEVPSGMLLPIFVMSVSLLLIGFLSGQIIDLLIQHAVPKGF
ncbi:MAG: monovalent cation/H+ antiporter subunit D family protein [Thermodesulfovibrionales bacterium]|nr:monovalent cation/H+ antiporter subunit D family protein [Thermodesulfovibrionales bacterium]